MALDNQAHRELLTHIRATLQELGRADLDELVTRDFQPSREPGRDTLTYLRLLLSAVSERSRNAYTDSLNLLNEYVEVEGGQRIDDIRVSFSPEERELYATDEISLSNGPQQTELLRELSRFIQDISIDLDRSRGRGM